MLLLLFVVVVFMFYVDLTLITFSLMAETKLCSGNLLLPQPEGLGNK
jgi:hypothetical protein